MKANRSVFLSIRPDAGKTSLILGLIKNINKKCAYMKPLGDRLLYKKKRLWDHDASLMTKIFNYTPDPEIMTVGFEHAKLEYMYDENSLTEKLNEMATFLEKDHDLLFIEAAKDLTYGSSVHLNAKNIANMLDASIIAVLSGSPELIIDDLTYLSKEFNKSQIKGAIINQVSDVEDFKNTYQEKIKETGIKILGIVPKDKTLGRLTVQQIADDLMAKIITGSDNLLNPVDHIDIGAMSVTEANKLNIFNKNNNLIITSGDRSDIMLAALEHNPSAFILSNGILPSRNVITICEQKNIPLLSVQTETFLTAKNVDDMHPLLYMEHTDKIEQLTRLVKQNINLSEF